MSKFRGEDVTALMASCSVHVLCYASPQSWSSTSKTNGFSCAYYAVEVVTQDGDHLGQKGALLETQLQMFTTNIP